MVMDKCKAGNILYRCSCRDVDNTNKFKNVFLTNTSLTDKCFVLLTQYRAGDKIKKNEIGWACGKYG